MQEVSQFIREALESKKPEYSDCGLRIRNQRLKHYRMSASPILTESSHFRGIVLMLHDMTPVKEMERMRREFVDNASHELKTPLSSIIATAETLMDSEPEDSGTRRNFYQTILDNTNRLHTLVNDLLDLSEIEQKKASLELTAQNLSGILREVVDNYAEAMMFKKQKLELSIADNVREVRVDKNTLTKALGNILDNAIKYSERNSEIAIRVEEEGEFVRVDIEDNGIGIPAEEVHRIFERFYRVDKARSIKSGGTGLGLSVAKHIIEAHRGKIRVTSEPGRGSKFSVYIPV